MTDPPTRDPRLIGTPVAHADVDLAARDIQIEIAIHELGAPCGVRAPIVANPLRQIERRPRAGGDPHPHRPLRRLAPERDLPCALLHVARPLGQSAAIGGQPVPAGAVQEQTAPERRLEGPHPAAERRGAHAQILRRPRQSAQTRDRREIRQIVPVRAGLHFRKSTSGFGG